MEEIINHLYSDKNLTKLSNKLATLVDDFGNTEEAMNYCKIWLKNKMKFTLELNKNNIKRGGNKIEIIKSLNTQCLKTALDEYRKKLVKEIIKMLIITKWIERKNYMVTDKTN
jgi:hypothetical protein